MERLYTWSWYSLFFNSLITSKGGESCKEKIDSNQVHEKYYDQILKQVQKRFVCSMVRDSVNKFEAGLAEATIEVQSPFCI